VVGQRGEGHELGRLTRGCGNGGNAAFESSDSLFEDVNRRLWAMR
jgi:hypothetical protein